MPLGHTGKVGPDNWDPGKLCGNKEDTYLSTNCLPNKILK